MLPDRSTGNQTYEEMMREALAQIPVYSGEWTNYNGSDPGITLLENLTAFQLVQQKQIGTVTKTVRRKLLKLAGYEVKRERCARVLLECRDQEKSFCLPPGQRFRVGDLSYETDRPVCRDGGKILAVYAGTQDRLTDLSPVLNRENPVYMAMFGREAAVGQSLYLVMDRLPPQEKELILYAQLEEQSRRSRTDSTTRTGFARLHWTCHTKQGFRSISCMDGTDGFLRSGELRMRMTGLEPAVYDGLPAAGYVLKGTLEKADYDILPRMKHLSGYLFEAWQRETKASCLCFQISSADGLHGRMPDRGYFRVYGREQKEKSYRLYTEAGKYKDGTAGLKRSVRIVSYQEDMMRQYALGRVQGYDGQEIVLPEKQIVPKSFCLIAERKDSEGTPCYDFLKPGYREGQAFFYTLYGKEGKIVIHDPGDFAGAGLYVGSLSISKGEAGNVRAWSEFMPEGCADVLVFLNPCPGEGGRAGETTEELQKRFAREIHAPMTAVTARDYEELVRKTPGLCIHKVKAVRDEDKNRVDILVKPYGSRPFPVLSEEYRLAILRQLEKRRLMTTQIRVNGPVYLPVHVNGIVSVKAHYERCRDIIEDVIRRHLDASENDKEFGAPVRFGELFRAIESLSCVEAVGALELYVSSGAPAAADGQDIIPEPQCLCCPGRITLRIKTII